MESRLTKTDGVVLTSKGFGEGHKMVRILTATLGKIEASAFGVRKTKSKFGSVLEPFSHVRLQLYRKSEESLYTIREADALSHNNPVRENLHKYMTGSAVIEPVVRFVEKGSEEYGLYRLLVRSLEVLCDIPTDKALFLLSMYDINFLTEMGYRQQTDICATCGEEVGLKKVYADEANGFPLCGGCRPAHAMEVEQSVCKFVEWAGVSSFSDARRVRMGDGTLSNLRRLLKTLYRHHFHQDCESWKHLSESGVDW